jgi:NADH:ubiquinone oxidoreductase subunit D
MQIILEQVVFIKIYRRLEEDIAKFCETFPKIINDLESLLTDNRIFQTKKCRYWYSTKEDALRLFISVSNDKRIRYSLGFKKVTTL